MCLHGFLKEHIMQLSTVLPEPFIFFSHTHTNSLTRVNGRVCINVLGAPDSVKARKCLEFCVSNFFLFFVFFRYCRVDMSPTSRCMSSECTMNNLTNNLFNFYPPTFFFFTCVSNCILIPSQTNEQVCFHVCCTIFNNILFASSRSGTARAAVGERKLSLVSVSKMHFPQSFIHSHLFL